MVAENGRIDSSRALEAEDQGSANAYHALPCFGCHCLSCGHLRDHCAHEADRSRLPDERRLIAPIDRADHRSLSSRIGVSDPNDPRQPISPMQNRSPPLQVPRQTPSHPRSPSGRVRDLIGTPQNQSSSQHTSRFLPTCLSKVRGYTLWIGHPFAFGSSTHGTSRYPWPLQSAWVP